MKSSMSTLTNYITEKNRNSRRCLPFLFIHSHLTPMLPLKCNVFTVHQIAFLFFLFHYLPEVSFLEDPTSATAVFLEKCPLWFGLSISY